MDSKTRKTIYNYTNNILKISFYKSKLAITTSISLVLLLFLSIIIFILISNYFTLTIDDFKISQQLGNFDSNFEILKIDGNLITIKNDFSNNLDLTSISIFNTNCITYIPSEINLGTSTIDISTCTENLSLETIYTVKIITKHGIKIENEILYSLP